MNRAEWQRQGRPQALAQPIQQLGQRLRDHGYTVFYLGDDRHLNADPPEDHCPFSATGWPIPNPYPYICATDIMPPPAGSGLPSLAVLGDQLYRDRMAGTPELAWLKYMNWTTAAGLCVHDRWTPDHVRSDSNDTGHIHISGRSDYTASPVLGAYDPFTRVLGRAAPVATSTDYSDVWDSTPVDMIDNWLLTAEQKAVKGSNATVRPAWALGRIGANTQSVLAVCQSMATGIQAIGAAVAKLATTPAPALSPADRDAIAAAVIAALGPQLDDAAHRGAAAALASARFTVS